MKIKVINKSENPLPAYETKGSAGMDIRAYISKAIVVKPLERVIVPTGLFMEIPFGHEAQVRPRSGLALKKGLTVLNSPGTIDSDYRGEIKVILINLSSEEQTIEPAERIAQIVIAKHEHAQLELAPELETSERGAGGFGHTGRK